MVTLGSHLTIANVREVHQRLLSALANEGKLAIDARSLQEIDVAGLQLLFAAHQSAARAERGFSLEEGPAPSLVATTLKTLGLPEALGCKADCPCQKVTS